jgi:sodium/bile acid cotransporter 7
MDRGIGDIDEDQDEVTSLNNQYQQLPINSHVMFDDYHSIELNDAAATTVIPAAFDDGAEPTPPEVVPSAPPAATKAAQSATRLQRFKAFFIANFLPIGFIFILIISLSAPYPGAVVASWKFLGGIGIVQAINNVVVFFISGLTLNTKEALDAAKQFRSLALGMVSILFVTPMLAFIVRYIPFQPPEFGIGLTIFCTVPTTLGVGVALTVASGGNHALSLLLTVSTNILGIFTVPFLLQFVLSAGQLQFDVGSLVLKLFCTVFIPSVLGGLVRRASPGVLKWVSDHRVFLSLFSTSNLICIIWQTLSSAAPILLAQKVENIIVILVASTLLHFFYLIIMYLFTRYVMKLPVKDRVAVVIMSAQKSAPVAVTVNSYITTNVAQQGLFAIPALIGQLTQIFVGSALARYFAREVKAATESSD